ncbi:F0F1 ATP synthase subunit B [Phenylobacterium sp.]|uniref:F0F1 ATP synthase subunit B n=1 Tax=Phenylobacterium sp. TaxID=1871053 RepID=UPI00286EA26B|nr:F0F1 ATP synthase subunit B [Phenylobacterium sp.]
MPAFLNPANAEMWVGVGLLIFLGIVIFGAKAPKLINANLDAQSAKIQSDLDEAARIREEAQRLLAELKAERIRAEAQAKDMLAAAEEQAALYAADAKAKLDESLARRQLMAERRIANAEAQAAAEVRAAAADLAVAAAEVVLTNRLATMRTDPMIDGALGQLATKMQ